MELENLSRETYSPHYLINEDNGQLKKFLHNILILNKNKVCIIFLFTWIKWSIKITYYRKFQLKDMLVPNIGVNKLKRLSNDIDDKPNDSL